MLSLLCHCVTDNLGQATSFEIPPPSGPDISEKPPHTEMAANPPAENPETMTAPAAAAPNGTQPTGEPAGATSNAAVAPVPEPRLPTRKDTSLKEFLNKMDDYAPIVRDGPSPLEALLASPLFDLMFVSNRQPDSGALALPP